MASEAAAAAGIWRSRPVFITSTFRDFQAERDWLRTRVFPELEERLRERRHHLEPIDLRGWGRRREKARSKRSSFWSDQSIDFEPAFNLEHQA